jgi:hypothetical protein
MSSIKKETTSKKRKSSTADSDNSNMSTKETSPSDEAPNANSIGTSCKKKKNNTQDKDKSSTNNGKKNNNNNNNDDDSSEFKPFDLNQILASITKLTERVPTVPEKGIDPHNKKEVRKWTMTMQATIEEFNLLLTCISAATYKWGSDRTGAADQNLSLLSNELGNAQEQISSGVTPRLTNVLAPVVELVTKETIVKKEKDEKTGEVYERRINTFSREENDPDFIQLCHVILCRNAVMLRHVVLTNFHKVQKCIKDYLKATKKDGNHGRSAGFY